MLKYSRIATYCCLLLALLGLSACDLSLFDLSPDDDIPALAMPKTWEKIPNPITPSEYHSGDWYDRFCDPTLSSIISEARAANYDMLSAMVKINKAQAVLNLQRANRLPEIDIQANASRTQGSEQVATTPGVVFNHFSIAAILSYQLDLWSAVANANKATQAELMAMKHNQRTVDLTVTSEVAKAYFTLIALEEQRAILQESIALQEKIYQLRQDAFAAGAIDTLALRQAENELRTIKQQLPILTQQREAQENALSVLLGRSPAAMMQPERPQDPMITALPVVPVMAMEAPASLLMQRPDIQGAEQELRAANANVGVARAAYFPQVSLGALAGMASSNIDRLFTSHTKNWQLGGNAIGPLLDFGRTQAMVDTALAEKEQTELDYQQTVRTAFSEMATSLAAQHNNIEYLVQARNKSNTANLLHQDTNKRYEVGRDRYEAVLLAKQNYLNARSNEVQAHLQALNATVDVFKALGGRDTGEG